jgi:D-sedoheptulose 7-phosphate isomerase
LTQYLFYFKIFLIRNVHLKFKKLESKGGCLMKPSEKTKRTLVSLGISNVGSYLWGVLIALQGTKISQQLDIALVTKHVDIGIDEGVQMIVDMIFKMKSEGKKLIVIGNGGSAAIAIHTLADYANTAEIKTADMMSPALLTCMGNDYGFENVFAKPVGIFADSGDVLFAISSSGESVDILNACSMARQRGCKIVTFSGFLDSNRLRQYGDISIYIPSSHYGFVELAHQIFCHCILDLLCCCMSEKKVELQ